MLLESLAYSGHLLEEAGSFYSVLDWNNGQKTHSSQGWRTLTLKVKPNSKGKMIRRFLLLKKMILIVRMGGCWWSFGIDWYRVLGVLVNTWGSLGLECAVTKQLLCLSFHTYILVCFLVKKRKSKSLRFHFVNVY